MWLDPARTGQNLVCQIPWTQDIVTSLVSSTNPQGTITNFNLELAALVLQEATLLEAVPKARMAALLSGSDNTHTVSWSRHEANMINPVVAGLLRIRALHSRKIFLNPSVFYHPGEENCIADYNPRLFYLSDTEFLTHMSVVYLQSHGLWQISLPLPELLSCMISTLLRKPCKPALLKMRDSRGCTGSGLTSAPTCWSILLSKIHPSLTSRFSESTATWFGTPRTTSTGWNDLGKNRFLRHGGRLQRPTSWIVSPTPENWLTPKRTLGSTSTSHGNSRPKTSKIPRSDEKRPPP